MRLVNKNVAIPLPWTLLRPILYDKISQAAHNYILVHLHTYSRGILVTQFTPKSLEFGDRKIFVVLDYVI